MTAARSPPYDAAMHLLTVNAGSSSVRLAVFAAGEPPRRVGDWQAGAGEAANPGEALARFAGEHGGGTPDVIAHRVVHGGPELAEAKLVSPEVEAIIERYAELSPLHNPAALRYIRAARERFGAKIPQIAVFDTAFYAELPEVARVYALPHALCERHGIRRYGFHGIAHRAMWQRLHALAPERSGRVVSLQLGSGASVTAVRAGRAVDTSMGFSPLEGLVMATRSGDVDPGVLLHLMRVEGLDAKRLDGLLNRESGLAGLAGEGGDMRALLASNAPRARLAVELYAYRARKYVGAYLAVLGGADAVVFGGGVGEHAPAVRAGVVEGLAWAGIGIDADANEAARGGDARLSDDGAPVDVWTIHVDEAQVIAEDATRVIQGL